MLGWRGKAVSATSLEVCFWRREQFVCIGGEAREYWWYDCCTGPSCEALYCEWRVVGSC